MLGAVVEIQAGDYTTQWIHCSSILDYFIYGYRWIRYAVLRKRKEKKRRPTPWVKKKKHRGEIATAHPVSPSRAATEPPGRTVVEKEQKRCRRVVRGVGAESTEKCGRFNCCYSPGSRPGSVSRRSLLANDDG